MKTIIIFVLVVILSHSLYSQSPRWRLLPNSPSGAYRFDDLSFINEKTGWVVFNTSFGNGDQGKVYKTTDGGDSWSMLFNPNNIYLRCIGFSDSLHGYIGTLGKFQDLNPSPVMYKTTNGGITWDSITFGNNRPGGLCGISVLNSNYIFSCGRVNNPNDYEPPYFVKTTNGGINWITQNMGSLAFELIDCKFFTPDSGFVIGSANTTYAGLIFFTSNGGTNWVERYRGDGSPYDGLWKLTFPSRLVGYASINGSIRTDSIFCVKTTNGGLNWVKLGYPVPSGFNSNSTQGIGFLNDNIGWTGDGNYCYKTTNGGLSWASDNFAINLNRIRFLNDTIGYAAGYRIYKFTTEPIGIQPISTEVPKQFSLEQNYPNPFNPATNISFAINETGFTNLVIYDVLGKEVTSLVNELLKPGTYSVTWDASGYPSGIYFYKLVVNSFKESKKMILNK